MQGIPQVEIVPTPALVRGAARRHGGPVMPRLLGRLSPGRDEAERFIAARYLRDYGAVLDHFLPTLVTLPSPAGGLLAAAGLAPAAAGPLFLEHYLDAPVEVAIARRLGRDIRRREVLEVGNLAAGTPGGGRLMIVSLVRLLEGRGVEWIAFTATLSLRNSLARLGIHAHELAPAQASALGVEGVAWGRYYDHDPRVVACSLAQARARIFGAGGPR